MRSILFSLAFAQILTFTATASAEVEIRVPILLSTSIGNQTYNVGDFQAELAKKSLVIPDFILVRKGEDTQVFSTLDAQIESAVLEKPKGNALYLTQYGRLNDYYGKNIRFPLCYKKVGAIPDREAAVQAYDLVNGFTDGILSDQYTISAIRFFGEDTFTTELEGEDAEFLNKYLKTVLKPGDVQIISAISDGGDDDGEDLLSLCQ